MVEIRRMGPQIGVEVTGVDVRTLDDAGFAPIYQAWLDHNVMVVRDQELTLEQFLHYSRRFGLVVPHPSKSTRHPEIPEITLLGVNKFDADGKLNEAIYRRGAEGWHTDGAYDADPFKATQLYALAIPSTGGDTLFANGYAAYAALPERLKQQLDGRAGAFTYGGRQKHRELLNEEDRDWQPVLHPIIRVHPETGRKSLYFDPGKIESIVGVSAQESDDLIDELDRHHDPAGRRVSPQVARRRHRDLGQPLFLSSCGGRLPTARGSHPLARIDQGARGGQTRRRIATPRRPSPRGRGQGGGALSRHGLRRGEVALHRDPIRIVIEQLGHVQARQHALVIFDAVLLRGWPSCPSALRRRRRCGPAARSSLARSLRL